MTYILGKPRLPILSKFSFSFFFPAFSSDASIRTSHHHYHHHHHHPPPHMLLSSCPYPKTATPVLSHCRRRCGDLDLLDKKKKALISAGIFFSSFLFFSFSFSFFFSFLQTSHLISISSVLLLGAKKSEIIYFFCLEGGGFTSTGFHLLSLSLSSFAIRVEKSKRRRAPKHHRCCCCCSRRRKVMVMVMVMVIRWIGPNDDDGERTSARGWW